MDGEVRGKVQDSVGIVIRSREAKREGKDPFKIRPADEFLLLRVPKGGNLAVTTEL